MTVSLREGDCLDVIPQLVAEGVVVDAIVTDPPYHLVDIAGRAARPLKARGGTQANGAMGRLARGFMGEQWDGGDIAFRPETWATVATVLRPGGFFLAFGGTRTFHRLVCAIEDAGFVIQDTIMWLYGSGFPKRKDMLKPAVEPICVAYKPGGRRTLQVDECRIGLESTVRHNHGGTGNPEQWRTGNGADYTAGSEVGRWPANICHDGSDEVMEAFAVFGERPGQQAAVRGNEPSNSASFIYGGLAGRHAPRQPIGDAGTAARFFYCAKAAGEDRWGSRHPTVKPAELLKWLVSLVTPLDGTFIDPFAGSGTAAVAALATGRKAVLIEREPQYCADIRERIAYYDGDGRHSLAAKGRNRADTPLGGLFA